MALCHLVPRRSAKNEEAELINSIGFSDSNTSFKISAGQNETATVEEQESGEIVIIKKVIPPPPAPKPVQSVSTVQGSTITLPTPKSEIVTSPPVTNNSSYLPLIIGIISLIVLFIIIYFFVFRKKQVIDSDEE